MNNKAAARREALHQARKGISEFARALEVLNAEHHEEGAEALWSQSLELWKSFVVFDEVVFARHNNNMKLVSSKG